MVRQEDFQYSTKFGVAANTHFNVKAVVRLMSNQKEEVPDEKIQFELAVFQDDKWDDLQEAYASELCAFKRNHASRVIFVEANAQGEKIETDFEVYS